MGSIDLRRKPALTGGPSGSRERLALRAGGGLNPYKTYLLNTAP